jgi:adenine-specific DNA-methyltransferase
MSNPTLFSTSQEHAAKALGAFYTDIQIADFLVWWAIRSSHDTVIDPSFGGGVFIRSVCNRILCLGGEPREQVFGVELDTKVYKSISEKLHDEFALNGRNLLQRDFFEIEPLPVNQVKAVVGNPPFIRFHRFSSDSRQRALAAAADQGVKLTQLSSSWAPFVVHSVAMLKRGGRLAMVLPMEIAHATYALPVIKHLQNSFKRVTFLTFRKKIFPNLSEDTLLLLAEDKGSTFASFLHRDLAHAGVLGEIQTHKNYLIGGTQRLRAAALTGSSERLIEYLLPKKTRELYAELKESDFTVPLGGLVDVGIGYVTGANDFFHLSPDDAEGRGIPRKFLRAAVRRGRALAGLRFTPDDWRAAVPLGEAGYLLSIPKGATLPTSVKKYLAYGAEAQVPAGYKCRVRSPWYSVPHVYQPDAFLSYMSGGVPRLVTNDAQVVAPNSLHILRIHPQVALTAASIATLWQTSLTRLSTEIEGHAMGGGMLKVEPAEAENCVVAGASLQNRALSSLAQELDLLIRTGNEAEAQDKADTYVLREHLGLSYNDCRSLKEGASLLMNRRCARSAS